MEVGEGMKMRFFITIFFCGMTNLMANELSSSVKISGDVLERWPNDFSGVAVVSPNVRHIKSDAFYGCDKLTAVVLPESLETIGSYAFSGCRRLKEIRIPSSVTNIGSSAFYNCMSMTNAEVFAQIKRLPRNMFSRCYGLRQVKLPDGLAELEDQSFYGCRSLENIEISSSVRRFGRGAFFGCSRLAKVEFPKGMEVIDEFAFYGCYDLKMLILHSSPKRIDTGAFRNCHNLRRYIFSDSSGTNALYSLPYYYEFQIENFCVDKWLVGNYKTLEEALSAADATYKTPSCKVFFKGLDKALRIAADGMVDMMPDVAYPVGTIDSLSANLFKLSPQDGARSIKDFFKGYSLTSVDGGDSMRFFFSYGIEITLEFRDNNIVRLRLSEGLKDVIRRRLKQKKEIADSSVLKWLQ